MIFTVSLYSHHTTVEQSAQYVNQMEVFHISGMYSAIGYNYLPRTFRRTDQWG